MSLPSEYLQKQLPVRKHRSSIQTGANWTTTHNEIRCVAAIVECLKLKSEGPSISEKSEPANQDIS